MTGFKSLCEISWLTWILYSAILFIFSVPFAFIDKIKNYSIVSFAFLTFCVLTIIFSFNVFLGSWIGGDHHTLKPEFNGGEGSSFGGFLKFYGIALVSMSNTDYVITLRSKLKDPKRFFKYNLLVLVICIIFVLGVSYSTVWVRMRLNKPQICFRLRFTLTGFNFLVCEGFEANS